MKPEQIENSPLNSTDQAKTVNRMVRISERMDEELRTRSERIGMRETDIVRMALSQWLWPDNAK